jgi:hypothetical protein
MAEIEYDETSAAGSGRSMRSLSVSSFNEIASRDKDTTNPPKIGLDSSGLFALPDV